MKIIDYNEIRHNLEKLQSNSILVVKDNAYGCGLKEIIKIAFEMGFTFFAVLNSLDAITIIKTLKNARVLVMGKINNIIKHDRIFYTVESFEDYQTLKSKGIKYHFKIKSSMNRFGMGYNKMIVSDDLCKGIYSHFTYITKNQITKEINDFLNMCKDCDKLIHIGGSSTLNVLSNVTKRIGISIYLNSLILKGKIIKVFILKKGQYLGYDKGYRAKQDEKIGIIDIGYNSGLSRYSKNIVKINDNKYQLVGLKCMDYSFVKIDSSVNLNDECFFCDKSMGYNDLIEKENKSIYELLLNLK